MKIKNLFFGAVIALAAFACAKQEEIPAGITVDVNKIEAGTDGKQVEVTVTSSEAWQALIPSAAQDWLHVVPAQGQKGVTKINVTVDALGSGKSRSSRINFMAGLFTESIAVSQEGTIASGDGKTPETAFSASEAYAWVMEHITTDNAASDEPYYVKGFIHKIGVYKEVEQYFTGNSYGNATFYMSDGKEFDPNTEKDFEAYQVNYLGNRKFIQDKDVDIKVGDEVIIYGYLTKYKETAETMQQNTGKGAYLYSLNGVVEEVEPQAEITACTVKEFIEKADPNTYYRLTGKVSAFKTGTNKSGTPYMQFNLTDETGTILVYGFQNGQYDQWATTLEDGGTVVLNGLYEYYADKSQHEVVKTTIESFEPGQAQTEIEDITVAEFIQKADATTYYRLTGKVSSFKTGTNTAGKNYMQFNLTDATGSIVVYGFKDGEYEKWAETIKDFGTVVLTGTYEYYSKNDQHEVMNTTIESFVEGEEPTEFEDATIADFIAKADPSTPYRLSGKVTEFTIDNADLKYMKITMEDATGSILVYSFKDGEFDNWSGKIKEGGAIVVVGTYQKYQSTHEVVNATIESFEEDLNYKYCKVDGSAEIKVAASATEAELKILANTAWTLTVTKGEIVATPASGEADATVKLTFPANESTEEAVEYTLTLAAAAAEVEKTITVTQSKAVPEGGAQVEIVIKDIAEANSWANGTKYTSIEKDGVTLSVSKGGGNTGKYYTSGNEWRFYQTESPELTISVSDDLEFVSAQFTYNTTNDGVLLGSDGAVIPSGGESTCLTYGVGNSGSATNGQVKFTKIVVTVTAK